MRTADLAVALCLAVTALPSTAHAGGPVAAQASWVELLMGSCSELARAVSQIVRPADDPPPPPPPPPPPTGSITHRRQHGMT